MLAPTVVVPDVKFACGPASMLIVTEPLAEVTTLPKASWTCTAKLGIGFPTVAGPGVTGLKAIADAAPAVIVSDWVPGVSPSADAVRLGVPTLVSP